MPELSVLIVGGSSGIGRACAEILALRGLAVTIAGRDAMRARSAAVDVGLGTQARTVDATDDGAVAALFATMPAPDHVVVSLAGGSAIGRFVDVDDAALRRSLETKFFAYLNVARHALRSLPPTGSLTFVTGVAGMRPAPGAACLAIANAAINGLAGTLAVEYAPIRVNVVAPGTTDTPAWARLPAEVRATLFNDMASRTPLGRIAAPRDVAELVSVLIHHDFLTGTIIPCDGGARLM